jgi:hypothetical protein
MVAGVNAETAGFCWRGAILAPGFRFQTKSFHLTLVATVNEQAAHIVGVLTSAQFVACTTGGEKRAAATVLSFIASLFVVSSLSTQSVAEASTETETVRGGSNRVERRATIQWQRVPLQNALGRLNEVFDEPIFVDRRTDPSQRVSLEIEDAPLSDVLQALSLAVSLGYSNVQQLHYLGPPAAAEQLRTVAEVRRAEAGRLPASRQASLELKQSLTWPRLTEPRQLITKLVVRRGWRISRAERIPHDLWAAGELPAMSLTNQLTVLLFGFDLTYEIKPAERTLEIRPLEDVTIRREYQLPSQSSDATAPLQQVLRAAKSHRLEATKLTVDARIEEHERLAELLRGRGSQTPADRLPRETKQVYTLRIQEQPVGAVLNQLAARLGWALEIDGEAIRAAGLSLDRRVSFSVKNSDEDELLDAVLKPAGLDFRRDGERLRIVPRGARVE